MSIVPDFVHKLLAKIAADEGLTDVETDFQSGTNHGDNFCGILTSVILRGQKHGTPTEIHLLCKLAPENEFRRQAFQATSTFKRETQAYTDILPTLLAFQREKCVKDENLFVAYPKCYAAIANELANEFVVIMGDLRQSGYVMRPKTALGDWEHTRLVMEQLGRFHGISFALKDQRPEQYARYAELHDITLSVLEAPTLTKAVESAYQRGENSLSNPEHLAKMKELTANWHDLMKDLLSAKSTKFAVLSHGDAWANNMLYAYDSEVRLSSIIFFETVRIQSFLCIFVGQSQ